MNNFSASLRVTKAALRTGQGVVAAQHRRAAEVGAKVLAGGGDAVDAAIATSFALGVLEPWMSGIGGGGAMVLYRATESNTVTSAPTVPISVYEPPWVAERNEVE